MKPSLIMMVVLVLVVLVGPGAVEGGGVVRDPCVSRHQTTVCQYYRGEEANITVRLPPGPHLQILLDQSPN